MDVIYIRSLVLGPVLLRVRRLPVGDGVVVGGGGVRVSFFFSLGFWFLAEQFVLDEPAEGPDADEGDLRLVWLSVLVRF